MGRAAGAFAEFALVDAREAIPVPARLSWEQAAAVPLVFMVVHDMLIGQGRLRAGEWLLVTGVCSGAGVGAVQEGNARRPQGGGALVRRPELARRALPLEPPALLVTSYGLSVVP